VSKEFYRLHCQGVHVPIQDALKALGTGILIFDHFESLKIVKRQFFLYTLFDSIHTNAMSLCVVIVTSSHEPLNNLEKRVRSRFCATCIEFPRPTIDLSLIESLLETENGEWNDAVADAFEGFDVLRMFEVSGSLHTAVSFAKRLSESVPEGEMMRSIHVEQTAAQMMSVIHAERFVAGMSQMELVVVIVCCYVVKVENYCEFTFDLVFSEMNCQLIECVFVKKMTTERTRVGWDKAIAHGLLVRCGKDVTKVRLSVFEEDVVAAMDRLPTEICTWVRTWK
jgi:hypothetical protein